MNLCEYIYIVYLGSKLLTCSVKDHGLLPFRNLQVKMFESSWYFPYVWVKIGKKLTPHKCITASLDAKNLFTDVPIQEAIKIIIENVYNHLSIPPPAIKPNILEKHLHACTTQVSFYIPSGKIYTLIDGISMDSPLGHSISEFYISHIEKQNI